MFRLRSLALVAAGLLAVTAAPGGAAPATSVDVFTGIRPGALMVSPSQCTMGFVFQTTEGAFDPAQQLYIGTAAHCVGSVGQHVSLRVISPTDGLPVTVDIGTVAVLGGGAFTDDFALVAIDPALSSWVSPSVAHWGGPTGADLTSGPGTGITFTGHGLDVTTGPGYPRAGVLGFRAPGYVKWFGATLGGDSGGPVTTAAGLAVAGHKGLVVNTDGMAVGVSIQSMLTIGGKPLSTCPSRTPWPLPGCPG
ncbi:MAG: hypothetical protein QOE45_497 [Frankiaceae bacterium]|jgi:hypothetical protein|nr:hypothetical protein [Frankiaceae bacterium]